MLGGVVVEVTVSVGSGVLELFKHNLCRHLEHLGIFYAEFLVTICWCLVHSWVQTQELLINFP